MSALTIFAAAFANYLRQPIGGGYRFGNEDRLVFGKNKQFYNLAAALMADNSPY